MAETIPANSTEVCLISLSNSPRVVPRGSFIVWRIVVGLSLIPAFGTLYQRLTLPESKRYEESRRNHDDEETIEALKEKQAAEEAASQSTDKEKKGASVTTTAAAAKAKDIADAKKNHFAGTLI